MPQSLLMQLASIAASQPMTGRGGRVTHCLRMPRPSSYKTRRRRSLTRAASSHTRVLWRMFPNPPKSGLHFCQEGAITISPGSGQYVSASCVIGRESGCRSTFFAIAVRRMFLEKCCRRLRLFKSFSGPSLLLSFTHCFPCPYHTQSFRANSLVEAAVQRFEAYRLNT
jgi:hypothetical protein